MTDGLKLSNQKHLVLKPLYGVIRICRIGLNTQSELAISYLYKIDSLTYVKRLWLNKSWKSTKKKHSWHNVKSKQNINVNILYIYCYCYTLFRRFWAASDTEVDIYDNNSTFITINVDIRNNITSNLLEKIIVLRCGKFSTFK